MKFEENAKLLTAESRNYDFDGKIGVSHNVRLNIGGEIYVAKSDEQQVRDLQAFVGKDGIAVFELTSRKEKLGMKLISFK